MIDDIKIKANWEYPTCYRSSAYIKFNRNSHQFHTTYLSCAVLMFRCNPENAKVVGWLKTYSEEQLVAIFKKAFNDLCNSGKKSRKSSLVFTNTLHGGREFNKILDKVCQYSSPVTTNVNTGNKVKTWIFTKEE